MHTASLTCLIGSPLEALPTPALVVDLDRLESNVAHMAARATRLGVALRPHVKTHKTLEIARLQQRAGAQGLTVSTTYEAAAFGEAGFRGLLLAFPLQLSRLEEVASLVERFALELTVDSEVAVDSWLGVSSGGGRPARFWLKVDCGYGRCGVDPRDEQGLKVVRRLVAARGVEFAGLLSHSGHAYAVDGRDAALAVAEQERQVLASYARKLRDHGIEVPAVSVGSTPAMQSVAGLDGITEARPGNYVFFDGTQVDLGSCEVEACALTVLSTVVSKGASWSVCDSGSLALSMDPGAAARRAESGAEPGMGRIFSDLEGRHLSSTLQLRGLSQEHGKLSEPLEVGTRLRILPHHSCLAVACFDHLFVVREQQVVELWPVLRGRA